MARLLKGISPEFKERGLYPYGDARRIDHGWDRQHQLENEAMQLIENRTTVVKQQIADGYAYYEVVKAKPLQIRWIPFLDSWEADPAWIRGLNGQDVMRQEQWADLFRGK
tara:strand:+ start:694 stop:1023 length:330 start_codon:yes stop_codon:yes gene_type:complete